MRSGSDSSAAPAVSSTRAWSRSERCFTSLRMTAVSEDGRAQRLQITAAGKRAVARALPLVAEMQGVLTEGFADAEIAVVVRFLTSAIEREL